MVVKLGIIYVAYFIKSPIFLAYADSVLVVIQIVVLQIMLKKEVGLSFKQMVKFTFLFLASFAATLGLFALTYFIDTNHIVRLIISEIMLISIILIVANITSDPGLNKIISMVRQKLMMQLQKISFKRP